MSPSIGIIGLTNAGKSTLFNALLKKQQALVASYPFTTIEPNVGIVPVPDERLSKISTLIGSAETVPATVRFIDIAGLVKDAHKGEGLGNQFLAHIREVDLICQVLRAFEDENVTHIAQVIDPIRDRRIVETELILKDLETLKSKNLELITKNHNLKVNNLLTKIETGLETGKLVKDLGLTAEEKELIKDLQLLTVKPVIYVVNVSEKQITDESFKQKLSDWQKQGIDPNISISAKLESELAQFAPSEQSQYLRQLSIDQTGLDKLIRNAYHMLGLITFYSGNAKQTTAWSIKKGTTAVAAAEVVHTDFAKKFIKAEVAGFTDFIAAGGWVKARTLGKTQIHGKDYIVGDGDIIDFKVGG